MSVTELERNEALAHFGVKGMKWGVQKARAKRDRRIESFKKANQEIASGTAKNQKQKQIATVLNATPRELIRNKGSARKIAAGRAAAAEIMQQRLESGNSTFRDRRGQTGLGRRLTKSGQLI